MVYLSLLLTFVASADALPLVYENPSVALKSTRFFLGAGFGAGFPVGLPVVAGTACADNAAAPSTSKQQA